MGDGRIEIGADAQRRRQREAGQIVGVLARGAVARHLFGVAAPQQHVVARARAIATAVPQAPAPRTVIDWVFVCIAWFS
jgi:hypothetical protein